MRLAALFCLGCLAVAGEPDGAVADGLRWTCARGCASQSGLSTASPVVGEVEEAWAIACQRIHTPPVHWHGVGYCAVLRDGDDQLIGFDLQTGAILASMPLPYQPQRLMVWNGTVILGRAAGFDGYVIKGKKFDRVWRYGGGAAHGPALEGHPAVHDNEVYTHTGQLMMRLRVGSRFEVWKADVRGLLGTPAVYGDHVYVLRNAAGVIEVARLDRRSGHFRSWPVADSSLVSVGGECELAVTRKMIFVRSVRRLHASGLRGHYAMIPVVARDGAVAPKGGMQVRDLLMLPQSHRAGTIIAAPWRETKSTKWAVLRPDSKLYELADSAEQPRLFDSLVPLAVLGNVVYFGAFAADVESRQILWKLPVEKVTLGIVPADRLFFAVDGARTLRAYREAR